MRLQKAGRAALVRVSLWLPLLTFLSASCFLPVTCIHLHPLAHSIIAKMSSQLDQDLPPNADNTLRVYYAMDESVSARAT